MRQRDRFVACSLAVAAVAVTLSEHAAANDAAFRRSRARAAGGIVEWFVVLGAATLVVGCARASAQDATPALAGIRPETPGLAARSAERGRSHPAPPMVVMASVPSADMGAPSATSPAPDPGRAPADPARGTPGQIACGDTMCQVGAEGCCHERGEQRCMPLDQRGCGNGSLLACDDLADCATGKVCCMAGWTSESNVFDCSALPCAAGEICLEGGRCSAGFTCRASDGEPFHRCVQHDPRATCGPVVCRGEEPRCCLRPGNPVCVKDECPPDEDGAPTGNAVDCTEKADCDGGEFCCQFNLSASCAGDCFMSPALCRQKRDCPSHHWGQLLTGCREGVCEYAPKR
ncbi:MAG: hypothetical protein JW751_12590 [Polyangiaceae bacterium]|nr:hypothetical protein [Polyangiaceae bacterium]